MTPEFSVETIEHSIWNVRLRNKVPIYTALFIRRWTCLLFNEQAIRIWGAIRSLLQSVHRLRRMKENFGQCDQIMTRPDETLQPQRRCPATVGGSKVRGVGTATLVQLLKSAVL